MLGAWGLDPSTSGSPEGKSLLGFNCPLLAPKATRKITKSREVGDNHAVIYWAEKPSYSSVALPKVQTEKALHVWI